MDACQNLTRHMLDDRHELLAGRLPETHIFSPAQFEAAWNLHPDDYHEIKIFGRLTKTPRWQQAYGADYHYTGRTNRALPLPPLLMPLLDWAKSTFDDRYNGLLLNWYEASLGHYIGKHRDSTKNLVEGSGILTISFGARRTFRLRPWKASGMHDFDAGSGSVFFMPYATNQAFTHEVPLLKNDVGRRISVTIRAFHPQ